MPNSRAWHDLIAVMALVALAALALPLLGSLTNDAVPQRAQPTALARVYLTPFRQVFAIGASEPLTTTQVLMYENGTDVFQLIGRRDAFAHLQTLDASMTFWTARENVVYTPPIAAQYDFTDRGKTARLDRARGMACLHKDDAAPPLSVCQSPTGLTSATLIARITAQDAAFFLVEVDGRNYFVSPEAVLQVR
ncbi:MAG: hypothetical protein HY868_20020 [Chloroflexi bacterium]|nr:hypothetical protein [Chloroflexota bacterium]